MTTETEMQELERRLAYREAMCTIESECVSAGDGWFDTAKIDPDSADDVEDSIRYLEWRGLLERREDAPHVVRVREE